MQYFGLAALLGSVGLALLLVMARIGWRLDWLLAWLKGCFLMVLLTLAVVLGLAAWELQQFRPIEQGRPAAVLELTEVAPQRYDATLSSQGVRRPLQLEGDTWELQVQVLRWMGLGKALGLSDGYRLARLNGRYIALEQQQGRNAGTSGRLYNSPPWRDLWNWLDKLDTPLFVEADAFVVRYMPLADGARFAIDLEATGVTPAPLNPAALQALKPSE
ncbi:hypothetical protein [Pseudomonas saliphila]|uniref:hypothetical protein n=1 Tax=Pseudomonas saliphila TaxID=2586906 RepID=UPI0012393B90|nr:hypothetical protein [Pseudomonas saliphila]